MVLQLITLPLVGALIGWMTNVLAIKLIFRPYEPITIPILKYRLQGVIPGRRQEIAANVGQIIGRELLSIEDVVAKMNEERLQGKLIDQISAAMQHRMEQRLPAVVPGFLRRILCHLMDDTLRKEGLPLMRQMIHAFPEQMAGEMDFPKMVEDKINGFDLRQLEAIILSVAGRELRHIEILGGVLGFLVGLLQALATWLLFR